VVPDDDLWLRWNRYRIADILGAFNRAMEQGKNQVAPQVRLGAVHGT
jgi:hypothetical protein